MADDPNEIRIPFSMTIPWKQTRGGQFWPMDRSGRPWPADRWGRPLRPFEDYQHGQVVPGEGVRGQAKQLRLTVPDQAVTADGPTLTLDLLATRLAWIGQVALYSLRVVGVGSLIAAGTADVVIIAAAAALADWVLLAIWGQRLRFASPGEAARYLQQLLREGDAGHALPEAAGSPPLVPSPPVVRLPGFTLGDQEPFQVPGLAPAAPFGDLPGFSLRPEQPLTPPDAGPVVTRPLVVEQAGRRGNPIGARSERARHRAHAADPEVTRRLSAAEWQAHHLINLAGIRRYRALIDAAARAGWRTDDVGNLAALPTSRAAQQKLQEDGVKRPIHDNRHPNWNEGVLERLQQLSRQYRNSNLRDVRVEQKIKQELERMQRQLRDSLSNHDRITQAEAITNAG